MKIRSTTSWKPTAVLAVFLFSVVVLASWMITAIPGGGYYEVRFFGKVGPTCCLYNLEQ